MGKTADLCNNGLSFIKEISKISRHKSRNLLQYIMLIKIAYPPKEKVYEFNKIYDSYFEVINYNRALISRLEDLRDLLLPKIMSGEIDVSEVNCDLKLIIKKFILNLITIYWRPIL